MTKSLLFSNLSQYFVTEYNMTLIAPLLDQSLPTGVCVLEKRVIVNQDEGGQKRIVWMVGEF